MRGTCDYDAMVAIECVEHGTCPACGRHVHHFVLVNEKGLLLRRRTSHAERSLDQSETCRYDAEARSGPVFADAFPGDL